MGQKAGEKWTVAVDLQPMTHKSGSLIGPNQGKTVRKCGVLAVWF